MTLRSTLLVMLLAACVAAGPAWAQTLEEAERDLAEALARKAQQDAAARQQREREQAASAARQQRERDAAAAAARQQREREAAATAAQSARVASLLIRTDATCALSINAEDSGILAAGDSKKLSVAAGDVLLECVSSDDQAVKYSAVRQFEAQQNAVVLIELKGQLAGAGVLRDAQTAAKNKADSDKFLAANKVKKGIVALPSGIQYRVIEEGNGARPSPTSEVTVHYRGSLSSGLEFDSSFARGQPASFKVDQVLEGLREVLPLMRVGDTWKVYLPPEKAYGERAPRAIGPNQALVFDIQLVSIK